MVTSVRLTKNYYRDFGQYLNAREGCTAPAGWARDLIRVSTTKHRPCIFSSLNIWSLEHLAFKRITQRKLSWVRNNTSPWISFWNIKSTHPQSWASEAMKRRSDKAMRWSVKRFIASIFPSVKRFIASLLYFFAIINGLSPHRFQNLPSLP